MEVSLRVSVEPFKRCMSEVSRLLNAGLSDALMDELLEMTDADPPPPDPELELLECLYGDGPTAARLHPGGILEMERFPGKDYAWRIVPGPRLLDWVRRARKGVGKT